MTTENSAVRIKLQTVGAVRQCLKKKGVSVFVTAHFKDDVQSIKTTKAEALHMIRAYSDDEALEGYDVATYFISSNSIYL